MQWTNLWAFVLPFFFLWALVRKSGLATHAVSYSAVSNLKYLGSSWRSTLRQTLIFTSSLGTIVFLTLAAARPQTISIISQPSEARNIMLALDLSGSMRTTDFSINQRAINRLEAVKLVVAEFIEQRKHDRIGLVVFGTKAFLQCPLTSDHALLLDLLKRLEIGLAGDGTAIGDGLGLALKRLEAVPGESKAIVLLTDGVNTSGTADPLQAATVARDLKIKVHTVGIGSRDTVANAGSGFFSRQMTKQYEFDEQTLQKIAEQSKGVYFNAVNLEQLQDVYQEIDRLERTEEQLPDIPLPEEHFFKYALWGLLCYVMYLVTNNILLMRIPW